MLMLEGDGGQGVSPQTSGVTGLLKVPGARPALAVFTGVARQVLCDVLLAHLF